MVPIKGETLHILVVEDHFLIAKQLEMIILESGHIHVGTATTRINARMMAANTQPNLAFVDVNLADGPSGLNVASDIALVSRAEVLFVTANRRRLPEDYGNAFGIVEKPFTRSTILATLQYLANHLRKPGCLSTEARKPRELELSKRVAIAIGPAFR